MLLRALFPRQCTICHTKTMGQDDENLCRNCQAELILPLKKCIFCDTTGTFLCHLCKKDTPKLHNIHICFRYDSVIQTIIQQYKFSLRPYLAHTISRLMWQYSSDFFANIPLHTQIIPMPSGRLRMAKRGFNPVGIIAKHLSQRSDLAFNDNYLNKRAFSIPQTELSREERLSNHRDNFFLKPNNLRLEQKRSILLIDDVITTGRSFQKALQKLEDDQTDQLFGLFIAQS